MAQGQFEAGHSQGFNTVQIMVYIVLPQAYRSVIPTMLGQCITTIKDSSYLANVAVIELMSRVKKILSAANMYNGTGQINVSDVFILFGRCLCHLLCDQFYSLLHGALSPKALQAEQAGNRRNADNRIKILRQFILELPQLL